MLLKIQRTDGEVLVSILKHKLSNEYSYINLTKQHICPCRFNSIEDALEDLKTKDNIISYQIIEEESNHDW